ncbi:uncharacterized protein V3H82_006614 [Fundulus diaphanus]
MSLNGGGLCPSKSDHDGSPNDISTVEPATGIQNAAEVSSLPLTNAPSESSYPPEPPPQPRSKTEPSRRHHGTGKHHRSHHRHHSPSKSKGKKSTGKSGSKPRKKEDKEKGHQHRSRHRSPHKGHSRSRSADNNLDSRDGRHRRGRSPERQHGQHSSSNHRHRSPRRSPHRSPRRSPYRSPRRSPYRSPRRSPYRSPHRHRSPPRYQSPTRHRHRSADPYRYNTTERNNEKPLVDEAAMSETPEPSLQFEDTILRDSPALDRLNREPTLSLPPLRRDDRPYGQDRLLMRTSSMERAYRGDRLQKDIAFRNTYRDITLPRVRTPDLDSSYQKYNSLLRGRTPELERDRRFVSRDSTPEPRYRARSLGRAFSPARRDDSEDEEDDDSFVAAKVKEYYSSLKTDSSRPSKAPIPEPKKTYKDNPKDLSI